MWVQSVCWYVAPLMCFALNTYFYEHDREATHKSFTHHSILLSMFMFSFNFVLISFLNGMHLCREIFSKRCSARWPLYMKECISYQLKLHTIKSIRSLYCLPFFDLRLPITIFIMQLYVRVNILPTGWKHLQDRMILLRWDDGRIGHVKLVFCTLHFLLNCLYEARNINETCIYILPLFVYIFYYNKKWRVQKTSFTCPILPSSHLSKIIRSCKCFQPVGKMLTLTYNCMGSFVVNYILLRVIKQNWR
jgi:hypothetical protein